MRTLILSIILTAIIAMTAGLCRATPTGAETNAPPPDNLTPATATVEDLGGGLKKITNADGSITFVMSQTQTQRSASTGRGRMASGQPISLSVNQSVSCPAPAGTQRAVAGALQGGSAVAADVPMWVWIAGAILALILIYTIARNGALLVRMIDALHRAATGATVANTRIRFSGSLDGFSFLQEPANPTPVIAAPAPVFIIPPTVAPAPPAGYIPGPVIHMAPLTLGPVAPVAAPAAPVAAPAAPVALAAPAVVAAPVAPVAPVAPARHRP